jgi:hypothetical protein
VCLTDTPVITVIGAHGGVGEIAVSSYSVQQNLPIYTFQNTAPSDSAISANHISDVVLKPFDLKVDPANLQIKVTKRFLAHAPLLDAVRDAVRSRVFNPSHL